MYKHITELHQASYEDSSRWHDKNNEWNKLLRKAFIFLVFLTYVHHDARFRECKDQHTEFVNFTQKLCRYFYKSFQSYFAITYNLKLYKLIYTITFV